MDHIKLGTRYYRDPAVLAANRRTGGQAELLFLRAMAQCGSDETEGHIPEDALSFLGIKNAMRIAQVLVEENLWVKNGDGWYIRSWEKWQSEHDILARRRKAERERKRAQRAREAEPDSPPPDLPPSRDRSRDGPAPMSRDVTPPNARDYRDRDLTREITDLDQNVALVDAHEHGPVGAITALYAAGVPLSDHGRAHRAIAAALDAGYAPDLIRQGVGRLIAEQRTCTPDTLRIAMHTDDLPKGRDDHRRTATEKASQWLTVGLDDETPSLRALPGGLA